jgi:hypothetical protein
MTRLRRAIKRAVAMLLPWPGHGARKAAVSEARALKEQSQAGAARAADISSQIERMAAENHFASSIAEQIIARHRGKE